MLTHNLVHLIEYHSDRLAAGLVRQVQQSERAGSYRNVPPLDLQETVYEIYHRLGKWLLDKREVDVVQRYMAIGARRVEQKVPLSELVWVIVLTKRTLWAFINDVSFSGRGANLVEKQELLQLLDQFFDQAIFAAVAGYEWATESNSPAENATRKAS